MNKQFTDITVAPGGLGGKGFCVWCGADTNGERWCSARCHAEEDGCDPPRGEQEDDDDDR